MAVGVPQVAPLHGHQYDGDLRVNDEQSVRCWTHLGVDEALSMKLK